MDFDWLSVVRRVRAQFSNDHMEYNEFSTSDGDFRNVGMNEPLSFIGRHNSQICLFGKDPGDRKMNAYFSRDIRRFCEDGRLREALHVLEVMDRRGIKADSDIYASLLQGCINIKSLAHGKEVHSHIIRSGTEPSIFLMNTLVNMYAKCGSLVDARDVFNRMTQRNVFTWTMIISAYAKGGYAEEALELFGQMKREGVKADKITFVSVLKACALLVDMEQGKEIHAVIIESGLESDALVGSSLVDMYAKCGSIEHARQVFDKIPRSDVVLWNAMITGCAKHFQADEAFKLFQKMEEEGVKPNEITFLSLLNACAKLRSLEQGKRIHAHIIRRGLESHIILGNKLIDMYSKCGSLHHARQVFDRMPKRDVVSWNVMIAACAQYAHFKEAMEFFWQMERHGIKPDEVTFLSILNACSSVRALEHGKQIHAYVIKSGFELDASVGSTLIYMYAKCGSIEHAREVFDKMPKRDLILWTAMIAGYAGHGCGKEAIQLAEQMQSEDVKLDDVTFVGILCACCHAGLVDEGRSYFDSMCQACGIAPRSKHYACMVDLFGRAGCLEEALDFVKTMPFQPSDVVWTSLLVACRIHGNMKLAKNAAECLFKIEPQNTGAFVLLSNMHAAAGKWDNEVDENMGG